MEHPSGNSNGYYGDNRGTTTPSSGDGFEDFMWMANEAEVEKEMLQQIQDEHVAEQLYYETVDEASLRSEYQHVQNDTSQIPTHCVDRQQWSRGDVAAQSGSPAAQAWSSGPAAQTPADSLADGMRTMSVADKPKVQLNPLAAEFVPGQTHQSAFQPVSG